MGVLSFKGDSPTQSDALVAKNYCNEEELSALNSVISAFLEFAEMQARRRIPMYMSDWIETLDGFLKLSKHEILIHAGKISATPMFGVVQIQGRPLIVQDMFAGSIPRREFIISL